MPTLMHWIKKLIRTETQQQFPHKNKHFVDVTIGLYLV